MELRTFTGTKKGDPLQTKYYCQVNNSKTMNVVMELSAEQSEATKRLPLRYVLLIDISGSMVTSDRNLLQRVKIFAELAVAKINENDWLSVVTFSSKSYTNLPMTRMTAENKKQAKEKIHELKTVGNTNLESDIDGALDEIARSSRSCGASRGCIILFTDGMPNEGQTDAKQLIAKYKNRQSQINESNQSKSCITLSAFTIGNYRPELLIEISRHLGSEAFYWLDEKEDFEADMLIPVFLRELTSVGDIDINIKSLDDSYFDPVDNNASYLTGIQLQNVKITENGMVSTKQARTTLSYFVHSLPYANHKNITFNVVLPKMSPKELDGRKLVEITIQYLDADLNTFKATDYILISTKGLLESRLLDPTASKNSVGITGPPTEVSAFLTTRDYVGISWEEAQKVVLKVAEQKCKLVGVKTIAKATQNLGGKEIFMTAHQEINVIKKRTEDLLILGEENNARLKRFCEEWQMLLKQAGEISTGNDSSSFSKLASMESSINMESPTCHGIFPGRQPFMSAIMEKKVQEEKKVLETTKGLSGRNIDVENQKLRMRKAIEDGVLSAMEQCFRELRALDLANSNVGEEFLIYAEKEIAHRKLENIKRKLEECIANQEFSLLGNLLAEIQMLMAKSDAIFIEANEDTFKTASNIFRLYSQIKYLIPKLSLPKHPSNYVVLIKAIGEMQDLKKEAESTPGLFTENVYKLLQMACNNRDRLAEEKARLQEEIQNLRHSLALAALPANYNHICQAIDRMKEAVPEIRTFGPYNDQHDTLLREAISNRELLTRKKEQITMDLQKLKPNLKLSLIPDNLGKLRNTVEKMNNLKEWSFGFDGVFTSSDESELFEASVNLKHLAKSVDKMKNARRKLENAMRDRNYKQLKRAVKEASRAPFIDKSELKEARKLLSFLDPEKRCAALKIAMDEEEIDEIEKALLQMEQAGVTNDDLVNEANSLLEKLKKQIRKDERQRKRAEKAKRRRDREMKRLDKSFKSAIISRDIETLEQVLQEFEDGGFEEPEIPIATEAIELLRHLKIDELRKRLQVAIKCRDVNLLHSAVQDAKNGNFVEHMKKEFDEAEKLLAYLLEMMRLREEIMKMTRASILEVHGYPSPPKPIFKIMKALFTILGERHGAIKKWIKIQALTGKLDRNSIGKRVKRFNVRNLSSENAKRADKLLNNMSLDEVQEVSKVAATFYAWAKYVVKEVEHLKEQTERKSREADETESEDSQNYDQEHFESDSDENSV